MSLIGFCFTIVQFFGRFSAMEGVAPAARPDAPRYLGLALIAAGTISLMVAARQYRSLVRYLQNKEYEPIAGVEGGPSHTPALPSRSS